MTMPVWDGAAKSGPLGAAALRLDAATPCRYDIAMSRSGNFAGDPM
jgi:hypothetical protein